MVLPKPLMPVQSQPVLELLLKWLRRNDVRDVYITTGYLGHLIKTFCGDGQQWDLRIRYTDERVPLGTVGPLAMLREELDSTFMVINGDVITDLSVGAFVQFHDRRRSTLTVATAHRQTRMDFGVIEARDGRITGFKEKPILSNLVSMGVYCMEPEVLQYVPTGVPFGIDDLILCLLRHDVSTHSYIHEGIWLDIGRIDDFQSAQELTWDVQSPSFARVNAA
jgi:mannose-1-phosphate guanylyltransferase